jgi:two-component system response regulator AtoC
MIALHIQTEENEWTFPLNANGKWRIGRGETCEIQVPDRRVSSEHAELTATGNMLLLTIYKGRRPADVQGQAVETATLSGGSTFTLGHTLFTVVAEQDGMNLIDTTTVLAGNWTQGQGSSPKLPVASRDSNVGLPSTAPKPVTQSQSTSMRLLAQLLALTKRSSDKHSLADAVLELACNRLNANRALLARVEDAQRLEIIAAHGVPQDADVKSLISTTVLKQIIDERQAVVIGNTGGNKLALQESVVRNHIRAVACTPVFNIDGKLAALLYVDNQDRPSEFSQQDAELLIWLGQIYSLLDDNLEMRRRLEAEVTALKRAAAGVQMIAEAQPMVLLLERVRKAAVSDAPVLIQGESGTGKEHIARMLHQQSPRSARAFSARNCAAIPENLFESEMFGHKKGAFTGADSDRKGAFVEADKGTLFLDEIGDLNFALQTKLLRALQEKVIRPVGGDRDIPVDVRLVCATNKDLRECLKTKEFREDLFYRIATVTLTVPPLRERREDVIPLARYFVLHFSGGARSLTPAAEERLLSYSWPGNVRELRSVIEQSIIFAAADEIQPDELNLPSRSDHIDLSSQSLADVERRHILNVLQNANGNKTEAARVLGLARSTLVLKLQSYGALGTPPKG